jgi:Zn-dependent protease
MSEKKTKFGIWALLGKLGGKVFSLFTKLLKGAKFTKVGLTGASFAGYAVLFSWKFALLLMIAVGFHESGHVWAMRRAGIKTKGFYFLPFIGGAAIAEEEYKSYGQNVFISIMGPVWGAAMAYACGGLYLLTGNPLWAAAAAWMATLNLFNLLPITPLDGGQLVRSIAFSINRGLGIAFLSVSLLLASLVLWKLKIGLFVLILVIGALELGMEVYTKIKIKKVRAGLIPKWKLPYSVLDPNSPDGIKEYPKSMSGRQLALAGLSYGFTIAVLVALLLLTKHIPGADLAANFLE